MPASPGLESTCPECGGRGWLVVADGGNGTARPCACRQQQVGPRLLAGAGIPERYAHCRISSFLVAAPTPREKEQLLQARGAAQLYVDSFLNPELPDPQNKFTLPGAGRSKFRETGLLFIGPPGAGKTHLAVSILVELIQRYRVQGRFVDFTSLLHEIAASFVPSSAESKHQILDPLIEAELLVLDELGANAQHMLPWVQEVVYLIINQRYTRRLPTIFTTNYRLSAPAAKAGPGVGLDRGRDPDPEYGRPEMLASRIPPALISRLFEMAQPVELTAVSDFRRHMKSARAGLG